MSFFGLIKIRGVDMLLETLEICISFKQRSVVIARTDFFSEEGCLPARQVKSTETRTKNQEPRTIVEKCSKQI